jgi:hypothetical protein
MKRFEYKKVIGFTLQQKKAFEILEEHGVNVAKFIKRSVKPIHRFSVDGI